MSIRNVCAALVLAALFGAADPLTAADLDGDVVRSPYDDPRYSDIYRHPAPHTPRYAAPYPTPPDPVYRDDRYAPPPYYSGPPPHVAPPVGPQYQRYGRADCLPQDVIREQLQARGWHDFHDPQVQGNVAHVRARRPNGRMFDLTVDRCSGEILDRQLIDGRRADGPPPPQDWRYRDDRYRY